MKNTIPILTLFTALNACGSSHDEAHLPSVKPNTVPDCTSPALAHQAVSDCDDLVKEYNEFLTQVFSDLNDLMPLSTTFDRDSQSRLMRGEPLTAEGPMRPDPLNQFSLRVDPYEGNHLPSVLDGERAVVIEYDLGDILNFAAAATTNEQGLCTYTAFFDAQTDNLGLARMPNASGKNAADEKELSEAMCGMVRNTPPSP